MGDPGGGKSRLARRVAERLHLPVATLDAGTCNDQAVTGSPRRWYSAYPSLPLATIAAHRVPNPALVVDEIEKAGRSSAGSLHDSLLSLLEPLTARAWRDQYLDAEVDLSGVSWICTANTLDGIPAPLRNRLRILRLPRPAAEHLPVLTASVLRDIAHERGEDERFLPPLDGEELSALAAAWGDSGSVRTLRRFVEALLAARRATTNPN
ncbi:AAA family ATPase [Chenggangzhangella methanolivorans]|uniref:AAA family ATPase n=1 Tax=Chenggangzhangella methanolivorans TaxID=1437009 RepID=A0A9E6R8W1_9HYPH|nr:AAA family ATPase [Chenggangzhangella methanolivorans]QZN99651.1 AAA family ATPase [Chenggangzhangella methanolivorans]